MVLSAESISGKPSVKPSRNHYNSGPVPILTPHGLDVAQPHALHECYHPFSLFSPGSNFDGSPCWDL